MNITFKPAVLVIEDELLIAMDLEQMLQDLGYRDVVLISSAHEAEKWLDYHTPAFAIVDIRIQGGTCESVANYLFEHDIPFVVCSGTDAGDGDIAFTRGLWMPKPCSPQHLSDALDVLGLMDSSSSRTLAGTAV